MHDVMKDFAAAILYAMQIREESFNEDFCTYEVSIREASDKGCDSVGFDERATEVVVLLLSGSWNGAEAWATSVQNKGGK